MAAHCMALLSGGAFQSFLPSSNQSVPMSSFFQQGSKALHVLPQQRLVWPLRQTKRDCCNCAFGSNAEKAFQSTVELDKFIDELREADHRKLPELVTKNMLSFDTTFWMRLATRAELCNSYDDKRDFEELATSLMTLVERVVRKTEEKIDSSTNVLKSILMPVTLPDEELVWPPREQNHLVHMKEALKQQEQEGFLDESFLSEVTAQMRQAKEDGDKPGLVAMLQKVLQLYAAQMLSKRSYALKDGKADKVEEFLEKVIADDEENWETLLRTGMVFGGGQIEPNDFDKVVKKRIERITMRTESGSYQQRIIVEYLKEIEGRAQAQVEAFQGSAT